MKRSPFPPPDPAKRLSRRVPLKSTGGLGQGSGPVRQARIRQVSAKRAAENRQRRKKAAETYPERPLCAVYALFQTRPELVPETVISRCGRWADDIHEPLTRGRGGAIDDPANWATPCRPCHDVLTFTPESELGWAYAAGLLVHSWDAPKAGDAA